MCDRLHSCKTLKAGCAMVCDGKDLDDVKARIAAPLLDYESVYILKCLLHLIHALYSLVPVSSPCAKASKARIAALQAKMQGCGSDAKPVAVPGQLIGSEIMGVLPRGTMIMCMAFA